MKWWLLFTVLAASVRAEEAPRAFALVVGVNQSFDPEQPRLRYADDDALRYRELFVALGARTLVLTRADENTARLHDVRQVAAPTRAELTRAMTELAAAISEAKATGARTSLTFVYAGHGGVRNGAGYVSLEDGPLSGEALAELVAERTDADEVHVVVDACASFLLAYGRGPGGERRALEGFAVSSRLARNPKVGLLLSTSSAAQSHEWEAFQAGVFSHEVRSGLYGGADADRDGQVSYREIAAFVQRANAAIPNERFRPRVYARAPEGTPRLVDLRAGLARRVELDAKGHRLVLEDGLGVRLADLHTAPGQTAQLVRPPRGTPLFLRTADGAGEWPLDEGAPVLSLEALAVRAPAERHRGAAHEAFGLLFSLPFAAAQVQAFDAVSAEVLVAEVSTASVWRTRAGVVGFGLAALSAGVGAWAATEARRLSDVGADGASHLQVVERNARIHALNATGVSLLVGAGVVLAASLVALFWPDDDDALLGALRFASDGFTVRF